MPVTSLEVTAKNSGEAIYHVTNILLEAGMPVADILAALGAALVCTISNVARPEKQDEGLEALFKDMRQHLASIQATSVERRH